MRSVPLEGIERDPAMPFLARALDPLEARCKLVENYSQPVHEKDSIRLHAVRVVRQGTTRAAMALFHFSITYLGLLFAAVAVDRLVAG